MAIDALAEEKRRGRDVASVIRGGVEPHGAEVVANARAQGLAVTDVIYPEIPEVTAFADLSCTSTTSPAS